VLDFHSRNLSDATMAIRLHEYQHPFGVVQTDDLNLIGFEEKPTIRSHINAGVYVLNPNVLSFLKHNTHCDMPTLYERLIKNKMKVMAFPIHEPWLDIGRPSDLEIANKNIRNI
jgi:NDP-sugar pyrophosphorylase family protein